jgi:hypothetical protein
LEVSANPTQPNPTQPAADVITEETKMQTALIAAAEFN